MSTADSAPSADEVVAARQPDPLAAGHFTRTFLLRVGDVADTVLRDASLPVHEWNIAEVLRDAIRRGLRPHGNASVTVHDVQHRDDGSTAVTYGLVVAPTASAMAVSTAAQPPDPVDTESEPEQTADTTPAAEAPVPASPWSTQPEDTA